MIADCFPFLNEFDLLEIRLNYLRPYVDRFVLCESPVTYSGNPKPLYFQENKERFRDFNIVHVVSDIGIAPVSDDFKYNSEDWRRERYQRDYMAKGIEDLGPEDFIMLSDVDEIPDMDSWSGEEGAFSQRFFYYYFNLATEMPWLGTRIIRKKNFITMTRLRSRGGMKHFRIRRRVGKGWHFSYMGSPADIKYKIESFSHQEHNNDKVKDNIAYNVANKKDLFGREKYQFHVEMPSGPSWLLQNKERYPHLWLK